MSQCWDGTATGCTRVTIHFAVDTIDSNEIVLGLGVEPGGLTSAEVRRIVIDAKAAADVVGFTVAEYFPRQVMHMQPDLGRAPPDRRSSDAMRRPTGAEMIVDESADLR